MHKPPAHPRRPIKAYRNLDFIDSPDARLIRILAEFIEPQVLFQNRLQVGRDGGIVR
jgi:hypothetical protein